MSGPSVVVGASAIGRGVFAAQYFQPGQPILKFGGPVLTASEVLALGPDRAYALQVGAGEPAVTRALIVLLRTSPQCLVPEIVFQRPGEAL